MADIERKNLEEAINEYGSIIWNVKGRSMRPLIRDSVDYVVIERPDKEIKPYDIVLYAIYAYTGDDDGPKKNFVLHRVIKKEKDTYIILGDNCINYERVPENRIIGVMTGLIRNGRPYDFDSVAYKAYVNLWIKPIRLRVGLTKIRCKAKIMAIKAVGDVIIKREDSVK